MFIILSKLTFSKDIFILLCFKLFSAMGCVCDPTSQRIGGEGTSAFVSLNYHLFVLCPEKCCTAVHISLS